MGELSEKARVVRELQELTAGMTTEAAAGVIGGIDRRTYARWVAAVEDGKEPSVNAQNLAKLRRAIAVAKGARSEYAAGMLRAIEEVEATLAQLRSALPPGVTESPAGAAGPTPDAARKRTKGMRGSKSNHGSGGPGT